MVVLWTVFISAQIYSDTTADLEKTVVCELCGVGCGVIWLILVNGAILFQCTWWEKKFKIFTAIFVSAVGELFCEESVLEDDSVQDLQVLHVITIY